MMTLYQKIIVPLDGSELSDQALQPAMLMAETTGANRQPGALFRSHTRVAG